MTKRRGSDFVDEVHEHAEHNINPYYWFNRVDTPQYAKWIASLAFAPIESVVIGIAWLFTLVVIIVDKSNGLFLLLVLLSIFLFISVARTMMFFKMRERARKAPFLKPKERKKKLPKRRKDYGRD